MTKLSIDALHCNNCVRHISKALSKAGIANPSFDIGAHSVQFDLGEAQLPQVLQVLADAGYPAVAV